MHLIGQGLAKHLYYLVTVSLKSSSNSCTALVNSVDVYLFHIPKNTLKDLGCLVADSAGTVPKFFTGKWVDPISGFKGGVRAVDWIDFMFFMLPTVFVPHLQRKAVRDCFYNLILACRLALQWEVLKTDLIIIKRNIKKWLLFLEKEIKADNIKPGVLKPTQHYLLHIAYMIEKQGCLKSYSARSMERTIGQFKRVINAKTNVGTNAGNILEIFVKYYSILRLSLNASMLQDQRLNNGMSLIQRRHAELIQKAQSTATDYQPSYSFNQDQQYVFDYILRLVNVQNDIHNARFVFLDGPGGTGKTFLFNALLTTVRQQGMVALAVAQSGTASLLLEGDQTAQVTTTSTCFLSLSNQTIQSLSKMRL